MLAVRRRAPVACSAAWSCIRLARGLAAGRCTSGSCASTRWRFPYRGLSRRNGHLSAHMRPRGFGRLYRRTWSARRLHSPKL